jgi:hypothetical protein
MPTDLIATSAEFGQLLHRGPNNFCDRAARNVFPLPTHLTIRGDEVWIVDAALASHARLYTDVAAIVPATDLADEELATFSVYACPTDTGDHIGFERPVVIGLYRGGRVTWYQVVAVETVGLIGSHRIVIPSVNGTATTATTASCVGQQRRNAGHNHEALAVFFLDRELGSHPVTPAVRKGRLLWTDGTQIGAYPSNGGHQVRLSGNDTLILPKRNDAIPVRAISERSRR